MLSSTATALSVPAQLHAANFLNLLVVDDDRAVRDAAGQVAHSLGFSVHFGDSAERAIHALDNAGIDAVLLDLRFGGGGLDMLRTIKRQRPDALVIVVTNFGTVQSAVQSMKLGAYDYITKPFSMEELRRLFERVAADLRLKTQNRLLRETIKSQNGFGNIVGRSPEMEKLYRIIAKAAQSTHPVLILGESGTGKEMFAKAIHLAGPLRNRPFIPVDCGSLVPTLIESELFGHVRGAFTGATGSKDGLLSIAEGGTVFLDEIGELPVDLQAKLLRAIQEKEIRPVGSTKQLPINVRILGATNRDLEHAVSEGTFRRDLFFRLNVLTLRIPPLRERRQDIPLLVAHFLERIGRESGVEKTISDDALKMLLSYDWPGNVRELENALERACVVTSASELQARDLPTHLTGASQIGESAAPNNGIVPIAQLEKKTILGALAQLNGDKMLAARLLGIGKTTLYRKLKEYELQS
jgi:DNA-binding NtrC family response regulator